MNRLHVRCMAAGVVVCAAGYAPARSQVPQSDKPGPIAGEEQEAAWTRLKALVGVWKGTGEPGSARVEQRYRLILQDNFLHAQTSSVSEGDTHEDWEILSVDRSRQKVVLRQFVSEGFINQYVLDQVEDGGRSMVFVSEACENAPPGFRARQTLTIEDDDRISQRLELAPAGRQFSQCSATTLARSD